MENNHDKGKATMITIAIVALLLGAGGGYLIGNSMDDTSEIVSHMSSVEVSDAASDTRVALNQSMRQHVTLASVALKDAATGSPETEAAVQALDNNSVEIAAVVGSVYGQEAQDSFLDLWRRHIGFFVDYTEGAVAGDEAKMAQAKADIDGYTDEASTFFATANPNIDKDTLQDGLKKHGQQVFGIVDAFAAGDYEKAFELEEEAYNHIGMAADNLAAAIVKQFPEKF